MFRRFGTPFAVDWLAKNVNGYVYTTAIPADPDLRIDGTEYSARYGARVPRDAAFADDDGRLPRHRPAGLRPHFADWWRDRLRPEMQRNFAYLEERLDAAGGMDLADVACLLEDAIDIHDRHWKIHWMLNFAQLSATLNLRAVMEKTRGTVDEAAAGPAPELGLGPQLGLDRGAVADEERGPRRRRAARGVRGPSDAPRSPTALRATDRGRRFIAERVEPYQREFGWHAVWSHEFIFPTVREQMEPVLDLVRDYLASDYDFPTAIEAMRRGHRGRLARDPRRADRRGARRDARRERDQPADGAAHAGPPLLHRPGRERARPPGAASRSAASSSRPAGSTSPTTSCSCATTSCGC